VKINGAGLAMTLGATWAVARRPSRPVVFSYFATQLTQQALWNSLFHAATAIAWREYSPALWTGIGGFLPMWIYLSRCARRQRLITPAGELAAGMIGGLVHAVAVRQQVF
jgi:Protein of unknown function with HXXEE motif